MTDTPQAPSQGNEIPSAPVVPATPVPPVATPDTPTPATPEATPPVADDNNVIPPQTPEITPGTAEGEQPPVVERIVPAADGYQLNEGTPEQLGQIFNQLDMTQEQADGVVKLDQARTQAQANALRQAGEAHIKNWGDVAETNINLAKRGMSHFDPTGQLKEVLNSTGYGNDPRLLEMFYQFGKRMEEGGFLPSEVNTPGGAPKDVAHMWYPDDAPGGKNNGYKS